MDEEREASELREQQRERRDQEQRLAESSPTEDEAAAHERRADKAEYLRRKLAERERSEP